MNERSFICHCVLPLASFAALVSFSAAHAQSSYPAVPPILVQRPASVVAGPYNTLLLEGGLGLSKPLHEHDATAAAARDWALSLWFKTDEPHETSLLAGAGRTYEIFPKFLALVDGKPAFWAGGTGAGHELEGGMPLAPGVWHSLAVSAGSGGTTHLFADGVEVAKGDVALGPSGDVLEIAPVSSPWPAKTTPSHFNGRLAQVSLIANQLSPQQVQMLQSVPVGLDALPFEEASGPWFVQTRGPSGMHAPQDPASLPHSAVPPQAAEAVAPLAGDDVVSVDGNALLLRHAWQMADAAGVKATGAEISGSRFDTANWMRATVPGTVLTTLIDRGVYPNPDYGLNNMAIPESLSREHFWFRTAFSQPRSMRGRRMQLTFGGINYRATIWLNGARVGEIVGAFEKKTFDVTSLVKPEGPNTLAVLIDPPPHPGIAHEQSLMAGSGDNGGVMMLDGPTFSATEGWDWIPGIRDRNMGLWQDVSLTASGPVTLDSPKIVTKLTAPDGAEAQLTVDVPVLNSGHANLRTLVEIGFDDVRLTKALDTKPGENLVEFTPKEFRQLIVEHPRLWWPNGYGPATLHDMKIVVKADGKVSDERTDRFGMRELTYELSAFDHTGHVERVEVAPTTAELAGLPQPIEQTHEGFRETPAGWVTSLAPGAESSPALQILTDTKPAPFLVVRVNGVRIAVKGGAWGMDDILKRVSREHLEPFFRLHKEANVNMIRNWMGQDTEDVFYELADEYGMLIWNDFWLSTQDWNLEADDSGLLLQNARSTIRRYRNHPSIAVWCGRNEGVPPPAINEGLARLIAEEDGTRYYSADSNKINLHDSGPYKYQEPEDYFTKLSLGFAVEVGVASPPTLEAFQTFLPKQDQWPISDDWAYHDWHQGGNGDTAPFMETMATEFGAPTSLADFDRKAQMLNYEAHRAIFEGMNSRLWAPNSGRLLWMTQPAWPSTQWQIFSHDYDTQASYYGVKKAAEPVHIQMNLPTNDVVVVNNRQSPLDKLTAKVTVVDRTGKVLIEKDATLDAVANATTFATGVDLERAIQTAGVVLIKLQLTDVSGKLLSDNFYWRSARKADLRALGDMPAASLTLNAQAGPVTNGEGHAILTLVNTGASPVIEAKATLVDGSGETRILPAYYSDNYVSLLGGETKVIDIAYPLSAVQSGVKINLRGWNVQPTSTAVAPSR